jgi:hypothetical protein
VSLARPQTQNGADIAVSPVSGRCRSACYFFSGRAVSPLCFSL